MKLWLFVVLMVVLALPVVAQEGEFLYGINEYGPTYEPYLAEDLRLPAPTNITSPDFSKYTYGVVLPAKIVTGEYYVFMVKYFADNLTRRDVNPVQTVKNRAFFLCNLNRTPASEAERDCVHFYAELGQKSYELQLVPSYGTCRGNVQSQLVRVEDALRNGSMQPLTASLEWSVWATALKWCQARFNVPFTVVPPTLENTLPNPERPPLVVGTPVEEQSPPASGSSDLSSSAMLLIGVGVLFVLVIIGMVFLKQKPSKPKQ